MPKSKPDDFNWIKQIDRQYANEPLDAFKIDCIVQDAKRGYWYVKQLAKDIDKLHARLKKTETELRECAAFAYQLAGANGANERVLDNFSALSKCQKRPHRWPYPADPKAKGMRNKIAIRK